MLTKIQQMLIVEEKYIFFCLIVSKLFFKRKIFVNIAETLFTAIFSKENIRKNGQKNEKCQNFEKNFPVNLKDMMT